MKNLTNINNRTFATNNGDEGLFFWNGMEWKQVEGTCDFDVRNVKDKKGKIKRFVKKRYE